MKTTITCTLDMLERLLRFLGEFPFAAAVPRAAPAQAALTAARDALRLAARDQVAGRNESAGGVDLRASIWRELRRVLAGVNRTARVLEEDHPGIRAQFRLPRTRSYSALLAAARAIVAAAASIQADFVAAGHAPDFLDEINALLVAFESATNQKHDGKITQVASTAALKEHARLGVLAATKLDAFARNHYRHQPEMLAAWHTARHIERRRNAPAGQDTAKSDAAALAHPPASEETTTAQTPVPPPSRHPGDESIHQP